MSRSIYVEAVGTDNALSRAGSFAQGNCNYVMAGTKGAKQRSEGGEKEWRRNLHTGIEAQQCLVPLCCDQGVVTLMAEAGVSWNV
jgi:hypothetical protein